MNTLNSGDKHMLNLVQRGADSEGWAEVSAVLLPLVLKLPTELVIVEPTEIGGRAKLTEAGKTVIAWL